MGTKSFGSILLEDWIEKLLFAAAILPGIPLLFLGNAQPWGKYVFVQYAYSVGVALWTTRHGRKTKNITPVRSMALNVLAIHIGFMLLILAGQYLWLYLFRSLPDFLTADSGQRHSASLYVLIGLILLVSL